MKTKSTLALALASVSMLAVSSAAMAQSADAPADEVIATGIRQSLENALVEKRNADSLVEVILAEDIGKLPDQNLAEVLENITGIQITRTAGVGTGVQIRGTNDNRVEINGVSTVGSGSGRSGISFEDVNAAIIAGVEVIKAPEASTIEGSVGGTVNLRTIRPLDLNDTLASVRLQGEYSELSTEGITPRVSGAFGKKWENASGQEIGIVLSGSYAEQEAVSFRPRGDVDQINTRADGSQYLGIQFLLQEQENFDYETINLAGTIEARPTQNIRLYLDGIVNDQQRAQDSYRIQASGVSSLRSVAEIDTFEQVDFGFGDGPIDVALSGRIPVNLDVDDDDPNLRFSSDTGARTTVNNVFVLGGEWDVTDRLKARAEFSTTTSETANPNLSTTLNFINPNTPLDGGATGDPSTSNDNSVPFIFDRSNETLSFGIDFSSPFAPTVQQLLDPNNVVLDDVQLGANTTDNAEDALRLDVSYDLEDSGFGDFLSSVDLGFRHNARSTEFRRVNGRIGGFSRLEDSPNGRLFSELLVPGPNNFGDADGRELFVANFLLIDPDRAFSDPAGTLAILESALAAQRVLEPQADGETVSDLALDQGSSYSVEESTNAFYAQANFDFGKVRGNIGGRYLETDVDSTSFVPSPNGGGSLETTSGSYNFFLPRANLLIEAREDVVLRAAYNQDILRPGFNRINTATTFTQNENTPITIGNPNLEPSVTDSFDISADWYFAPASVFSIGYFNKSRDSIIRTVTDEAALSAGNSGSGLVRETSPDCPGGGIFNPVVLANQFAVDGTVGYCVDLVTVVNDADSVKQEGIEVSFQHSLSDYEDRMGGFAWASGFGLLANYTYQQFSGGSVIDSTGGRGLTVLGDQSLPQGLLDNSENAYNVTVFYEKHGLSARARYTWRDEYRTQDFAGGASVNSTFSFPVVNEARGQLNASINYDVTDNFNIGIEGVNLTKANVVQRCVVNTGPICFVGNPDRRIVFGGSYTF